MSSTPAISRCKTVTAISTGCFREAACCWPEPARRLSLRIRSCPVPMRSADSFRPFGDNRTAIRAGYGIFYSMVDGQATRQLERNPPNGQIINVNADQNQNSSAPDAVTVTNLFPAAGTPASQPSIYSDLAARGD